MKKEIAERWVSALRSGEYKQGKLYLKSENGYCCLGVLCDILGVEWKEEIWRDSGFKKELNTWGAEDSAQQTGDMPAHVEMASPLTAIGQIRDAQYYPQYPTGNVLFFVNYNVSQGKHIENLVPLQKIYQESMPIYTFNQRQTLGSYSYDMFKAQDQIFQIYESNKRIMLDPKEFVGQHVRTDDIHKGRPGTRARPRRGSRPPARASAPRCRTPRGCAPRGAPVRSAPRRGGNPRTSSS